MVPVGRLLAAARGAAGSRWLPVLSRACRTAVTSAGEFSVAEVGFACVYSLPSGMYDFLWCSSYEEQMPSESRCEEFLWQKIGTEHVFI